MRHPFLFASDTTSTIVRRKRAKSSTISSNPAQFDDFIDEKRHFRRLFVDLKTSNNAEKGHDLVPISCPETKF